MDGIAGADPPLSGDPPLSRATRGPAWVYPRGSHRAERFTQEVVAELQALSAGQDDLREESRARAQALLRVLDRVGPGPSSA